MNIMVIGGMYPPMRTGTAFYTQNLALALQARGHRVTVVSLEVDETIDDLGLDVRRLPAMRLPMKNFFKHFRICSLYPRNWFRVRQIADEINADAILLVNHYLDIAFPAAFAARRKNVPLLCSVGTQLQSLNPRRDRILNFLDRLICGRLVFPFCSRVIAWDTQIKKYLLDVQGKGLEPKTVVVNYGVSGDPAQLLAVEHDYRAKGVIVGVGAVSEQRSFVPLVRAFALLHAEMPELRLRIVGHVYYDEAIRVAHALGVGDAVTFLGEQSHDQVINEMHGADVFYSSLTGKYTAMGTATIEAMLLSVPSVANTPLDLLGTGMIENGLHLVQSLDFDPQHIASCIGPLLRDEAMRKRVGQGGRDFVRRYLNWEVVARDMEAVIEEVQK